MTKEIKYTHEFVQIGTYPLNSSYTYLTGSAKVSKRKSAYKGQFWYMNTKIHSQPVVSNLKSNLENKVERWTQIIMEQVHKTLKSIGSMALTVKRDLKAGMQLHHNT